VINYLSTLITARKIIPDLGRMVLTGPGNKLYLLSVSSAKLQAHRIYAVEISLMILTPSINATQLVAI